MTISLESARPQKPRHIIGPEVYTGLVFIFYFLTCFRTFTWWDSSEYSIAALTLGVPHPPGSLLTVFLGWAITQIPLGIDKFFALNLTASVMAAISVYLVGDISFRLFKETAGDNSSDAGNISKFTMAGMGLATIFFGFSATLWYYAIRFTPYITTALLTALLIMAILQWMKNRDNPSPWRLFLILLLFGLDFSIHRTNLLMLPAFLIWALIARPRAYLSLRNWIYGASGYILGLAVQLLLIPIAAAKPLINFNNPDTLARFWDYITLKQYGGGWLINMYPRKAPFFDIQITDYIKDFADNFANSSMMPIGFLPLVLGLAGLVFLIRKNWRLGIGLLVMFLFSSLGAILYFNLPENFFRSLDRHYLPSFVIFGIFIIYGAIVIFQALSRFQGLKRSAGIVILLLLLILLPIQAIVRNTSRIDGSESYFAYDTAKNYLNTLPQNAILFTQADIDTYTLWCLQVAEKYRTDVTVCNISLMNTSWFVKQIMDLDPDFPVRLRQGELDSLAIIPWEETTISIPAISDQNDDRLASAIVSDSLHLTISPSVAGKFLLVQDQMILKTIQANNWKRPICFSSLLGDQSIPWLKPYLRQDGMFRTLVSDENTANEYLILEKNLCEKLSYRGYMDNGLAKDDPTKWIGWNLCGSFLTLASMQYAAGDTVGCVRTIGKFNSVLSPADIEAPQQLLDAISGVCK